MRFQIFIDREFDPLGQFEYKAFLSRKETLSVSNIAHGSGRTPWEAVEDLKSSVNDLGRQCGGRMKTIPDALITSISPRDLRKMADCIEFIQGQSCEPEVAHD